MIQYIGLMRYAKIVKTSSTEPLVKKSTLMPIGSERRAMSPFSGFDLLNDCLTVIRLKKVKTDYSH